MGTDYIRGSSDIPLSPQGMEDAHQTGIRLMEKGGLDKIATSSLLRARQTAKIISHYTHAPIVYEGDKLHPWHLGGLEGQPTKEVLPEMERLIKKSPDEVPQGRGPLSSEDGESFNSFARRGLSGLKMLLAEHTANPEDKIGATTHYRDIRLANAWHKEGGVGNDNISIDEMLKKSGPPGSVWKFHIDPTSSEAKFDPVDLSSPDPLSGGVYLIRHGATEWNEENGK